MVARSCTAASRSSDSANAWSDLITLTPGGCQDAGARVSCVPPERLLVALDGALEILRSILSVGIRLHGLRKSRGEDSVCGREGG